MGCMRKNHLSQHRKTLFEHLATGTTAEYSGSQVRMNIKTTFIIFRRREPIIRVV